ncbi:MAG: YkgJ family cysteine cluster protein [Methanomassiliicoccales archaeon]|nr:YkgJ family cysteine cluster protein [Methanomassiliicoccales archaeon]
MHCTHCSKCCQETRMELCRADIARLIRRGYADGTFYSRGEDGIPRLINVNGHCVLFDPDGRRCKEYRSRPLGCALYPVNLTEDGIVVIDALCPEGDSLGAEEVREKGERLRRLIATIDAETSRH